MTKGTYLTPRAFIVLAVWQCVGIAAQWSSLCLALYVIAVPLLLALGFADRRSLMAPAAFLVRSDAPEVFELDIPVTVRWRIFADERAPGARPASLAWRAAGSALVTVTPEHGVAPRDGKQQTWTVTQEARAKALGTAAAPVPEIEVRSAAGYWGRRFPVAGKAASWQVVPSRDRVPEQEFERAVSQQRTLFQGARLRMRDRSPDQYLTTRKYRYPDSLRQIDHKKSARYGELMTRTYESLRQQHLVIALDLGRAMTGRIGGSDKLAFYLAAAWTLVDVAIRSGDRVSVFAFSRDVSYMVPRSSQLASFAALHRGDPRLTARPVESDYRLVGETIGVLGAQRSLVVLLTDASRPSLQDELLVSLRGVCRKHLTLTLSLVDRANDVDQLALTQETLPKGPLGTSQLVYAYWLRESLELFRRRMTQLGGGLVTAPERHWLDMTQRVYRLMRDSAHS